MQVYCFMPYKRQVSFFMDNGGHTTKEKSMLLAEKTGFSHWGIFPASGIRIIKEVRHMCASDKCHMYGRNWSCPPACITLDEAEKKISGFVWGILMQTTGYLEDVFDYETMQETESRHKKMLRTYAESLDRTEDHLILGSGACSLCEECTCPVNPCRMPDKMTSSMEAYGIMVADVCSLAGMAYHYGDCTVTYSGCVLFR